MPFSISFLTSSKQFAKWMLISGLGMMMVFSAPVSAEITEMETFKDWSVYRDDTQAGRICYMSSEPTKLRGDYDRNNRGETRIFVTHGPGKADRNVVSVLAGYKYKKQSDVIFKIDGRETTLFTMDNRAWSLGPEDLSLIHI